MSLYAETRIVLAVDLDYFYAQCEEIRNPEIKGKPVVICVYSGRTVDSGAVSTANYVARSLGVRSGIPIILAKRLLAKHPEARFLPMDREFYESVSERIMQILRYHSSKIEQVSIDEAYLDVSENTRGDFAVAEKIATEIKSEILEKELLTCSVGVGSNKLISKMAVDAKKPDGLTTILPSQVHQFLDPLLVGKLFGIGTKTEKKLGDLGIKTIGDLANYDVDELSEEFGPNLGPLLKRLAQGIDDDPVKERETEQLSRIVTLKHDADGFDFASEITPLCKDISNRLVAYGLVCKSIGILVITTELKTKNRSKTLDAPTNSEVRIESVASELFQLFFREENETLARRVGIRVSSLTKTESLKKDASLTEFFS